MGGGRLRESDGVCCKVMDGLRRHQETSYMTESVDIFWGGNGINVSSECRASVVFLAATRRLLSLLSSARICSLNVQPAPLTLKKQPSTAHFFSFQPLVTPPSRMHFPTGAQVVFHPFNLINNCVWLSLAPSWSHRSRTCGMHTMCRSTNKFWVNLEL